MVIICNRAGGLGNRLFVFAHFLANAIEFNYEIANPSFLNFAKYFEITNRDIFCRYPTRNPTIKSYEPLQSLLCNSADLICRILPKINVSFPLFCALDISSQDKKSETYNLAGQEFVQLRSSSRFVFVRGWLFRDFSSIRRHVRAIRKFFVPTDPYMMNISHLVNKAKQDCDILIGVHIRQGDYSTFSGGKYMYSSHTYMQYMQQAIELFPNKKVKFLICSNVAQNESYFKDFSYVCGTGHLIEDMYAFANCDFLIGPPSTYTGWSSFYGSIPIFTITRPDENISLENIIIWEG